MSNIAQNRDQAKPGFLQTRSGQKRLRRIIQYSVAVLFVFYALFPVIWILSASLDPRNSLQAQQLIPPNATLENYTFMLTSDIQPFPIWMWNSLKVSVITSILSVILTAMAAYAFSRFRFYGRRNLMLLTFLLQVFPASVMVVAIFNMLRLFGEAYEPLGLNSHGGLILTYLGGVMGINVWLMKGFFDTVPRALDESASIDGASHWQIFWQIVFPLVRPVLVIVGLLTFVGTWGDFLLPSLLLQDTDQFTVAAGLIIFARQQFTQNWGVFSAGALMGAVPTIVIYLLLQDYVVNGLTAGAVKG